MALLLASKPQVVVVMGALYPNTAAALLAILVSLPSAICVTLSALLPLTEAALKQLPAAINIGGRIVQSSYGPLYTDTSYTFVSRFRNEVATYSTTMNLTTIDASPSVGTYLFFGWIMGELLATMSLHLDTFDGASFRTSIFDDSIYSIDDDV